MAAVILLIIVALWFLLGNPASNVANVFWPGRPAPWETVDAFYYPDRDDLTVSEAAYALPDIQTCREWVRFSAVARGDPELARGDYECGFGYLETMGTVRVYRDTAR